MLKLTVVPVVPLASSEAMKTRPLEHCAATCALLVSDLCQLAATIGDQH